MSTLWNALDADKRRELEAIQMDREIEMLDLGAARYWRSQEGDGKPEESFIHEAGVYLLPAIKTVRKELTDIYESGQGRMPQWAPAFMWLSDEHIIVLLLRALIPTNPKNMKAHENRAGMRPWDILQQSAAKDLSGTIWQLAHYHMARNTFNEQWEHNSRYIKNWDRRQQLRFTKKVMDMPKLNMEARLSLGIKLLNIAEMSGIAEKRQVKIWDRKKFKTLTTFGLQTEILDELSARHDLLQWLRPKWQPMVAPPNDWTKDEEDGAWSGGYYLPGMQMRLVRPATPGYEFAGITEPGDSCVEAVNAVQSTPFQVNEYIYRTMKLTFEQNLELATCPVNSQDEFDFQRFEGTERDPEGKVTDEFRLHLRQREAAHSQWYKSTADRQRMIERLALAEQMLKFPAYWLAVTMDFRTRFYTSTEMLSPQGCDFDKGLCMLGMKKKQTERGRWWLKIHIANNFGVDKVSFEDRVKWVDEHEAELRASVEDPISNRFWTEADDKHQWQALAAAHDLYVDPEWTQVAVQMDGSCNGIQHWSAMGRDTIGATATNLIDSEVPNDLYSEVADELKTLLDVSIDPWAERWLPRVARKLAKRPCMTYPYGVTRNGIQKALVYDGHCAWIDPEQAQEGAGFITAQLMRAIPNVVYSSHHYMVWIKEIARLLSRDGKVLGWMTPAGSSINHGYYEMEIRTLSVENQRIQFAFSTKGEPVVDRNAAVNGIAPNFVHSMDASHMQLTICEMLDEGIEYFSMIHDSYGCHACDVETMQRCIRNQFVLMYTETDPIVDFAAKAAEETGEELPTMPLRGDFELSLVRKARYFFS